MKSIKELVSFLSTKKEISDDEKQGRTSGSVEWRRARGELGQNKEVQKRTNCNKFASG